MSLEVVWTENAERRLAEIEEYIAEDSPMAAETFVAKLVGRGESLKDSATRGRPIPELPASGIREVLEGNYRIMYRIGGRRVEILTVFEGHRLLDPAEL